MDVDATGTGRVGASSGAEDPRFGLAREGADAGVGVAGNESVGAGTAGTLVILGDDAVVVVRGFVLVVAGFVVGGEGGCVAAPPHHDQVSCDAEPYPFPEPRHGLQSESD